LDDESKVNTERASGRSKFCLFWDTFFSGEEMKQRSISSQSNQHPIKYRCGTETGGCYNRRVIGNIRSRLEECLPKGGGQFEDVVFKK